MYALSVTLFATFLCGRYTTVEMQSHEVASVADDKGAPRDEIRYALWPDQWTKPVYCQNDFADIRMLNIFEIDGDYDLFNDGALKLVKTPGHSPGLQVLMLDLPNRGRICLAADTGHQRDGFENMVPMPWDWSLSGMTLTRQRIKQLERSGVPCFFCHDGSDFAKLPQNGEYWD
jgi:N-acyl homoserine lactone hydrolase